MEINFRMCMFVILLLLWNVDKSRAYENIHQDDDAFLRADTILGILREHSEICPSSPFCSPVTDSHFLPVPCCQPCNGEFAEASTTNCCPKKIPPDYAKIVSKRKDVPRTCTRTNLRTYIGAYIFATCPEDAELQLSYNCTTNDIGGNLTENVPVTHLSSGNVYKNIFCAMCNAVSLNEIEFWQTKMQCQNMDIFSETDITLGTIIDTPGCNLIFEPVSEMAVDIQYCNLQDPHEPMCNTSGQWHEYDALLEYGCHFYDSMVFVPKRGRLYSNIFCAYCDGVKNVTDVECTHQTIIIDRLQVGITYSAIVNPHFTASGFNSKMSSECQGSSMYNSAKSKCIVTQCSLLRRFDGEACRSVLHNIDVFTYEAVFRLISELDITLPKTVFLVPTLATAIADSLFKEYNESECYYQTMVAVGMGNRATRNTMVRFIDIKLKCLISMPHDPELVLKTATSKHFKHILSDRYPFTVFTRDVSGVSFNDTVRLGDIFYQSLVHEDILLNQTRPKNIFKTGLVFERYDPLLNIKLIPYLVVFDSSAPAELLHGGTNLLSLKPCPMTFITREEHSWVETLYGLLFRRTNIHLNSMDYHYQSDDKDVITVCVGTYRQITTSRANVCQTRMTLKKLLFLIVFILFYSVC